MKQVSLTSLALALAVSASSAGAVSCFTDTTQADFQAGVGNSIDLTTSSGNVLLARQGSGSINQQNTSFTNNGEKTNATQWTAQGFTPSASGSVTRVDLNMFYVCTATPPPVTVSIRATSGGLPTGADLGVGSLTISTSGVQQWWTANFTTPASVSAGTQYAIVVRASATIGDACMAWSDTAIDSNHGNDVYPGGFLSFSINSGSSWQKETQPTPSVDGAFKVYIGSSGSGYVSAGDLVSSLKDTNPGTGSVTWSQLAWNSTIPANTAIKFQAAASNSSSGPFNFVGPDGTASSYFTTTNASLAQFSGNRYFKYHAFLSTSDGASTPTLADATACYSVGTAATSSDVGISVSDASGTVVPGTTVSYTITASNAGPDAVTGAKVTDTFPAPLTSCSWTCAGANGGSCASNGIGNISQSLVNLPVGGTATYTATCSLPSSATGSLANTATIADPTGVTDSNSANNSSTDTDTVTPKVDLSVTNSDSQTSQQAGTTVTYAINTLNTGPSDAPNSIVTDSFPSTLTCTWTCAGTFGGSCPASGSGNINASVNLPKGGHANFTATCSLASSATGSLVNTAAIAAAAGVTDTNTTNNSVTDTDSIVIRSDVAITMTDNVDNVQVGEVVNYVINVTDNGPSDAAAVNLVDTLPAQLGSVTWVCSATGGAACAVSKGKGSLNENASVPVGGVATYVITATVVSDDSTNSIANYALAHVSTDPSSPNNSATDTDAIVIFVNDFASGTNAPVAVNSGASAAMTADLGVDAGLLKTLGPAPVTVATATSASGAKLFSLQLMRAGHDVLMRSLTPIDGTAFSDVAPWQAVDLGQHRIGFEWRAATSKGDDGFLRAGSATQQTLMAAHNSREAPAQLQIATVGNIPWLVLVEP